MRFTVASGIKITQVKYFGRTFDKARLGIAKVMKKLFWSLKFRGFVRSNSGML